MASLTDMVVPPDPSALLWDRMAGLRLRLRDTVAVHAHRYRGRRWCLLSDALGRQQYRLSHGVYQVLAELDGRRTLAQVWERMMPAEGIRSGAKQELLTALTQLQAAGVLAVDSLRDVRPLIALQQQQRRRRGVSRWLRLLSPRISLFDPDRLLARGLPLVGWMFHPFALVVWLGTVGLAGLQALVHWEALALYGAQRLDDPRSWLLLVCLYPLVKALHELGHGFAAKWGGAEVNELGITLLVFVPVPYVDASAASLFQNKYRRMLVGAAGILVEALLAALALFAWLHLPDGVVRDAAFSLMVIGGASTVLFNGNPLLRFDGYYVLADAIEIPNLATRAARYYGYLVRRYALGLGSERSPVTAPGERSWFLFYGVASTLYRLVISVGIALFLIAMVPVLGVVLATWLLAAQWLFPFTRQLHFLLCSPALSGRRLPSLLIVGGMLLVFLLSVAVVPFPYSTKVDGVVLLPEQAIVRVEVEGFFARQLAAHGAEVKRGDALFTLTNRQLEADIAILDARVKEFAVRRGAVGLVDRVARGIYGERLAEARAELAELERRRDGLIMRSPVNGVLRVPRGGDLTGRLVRQGDFLAYIADRSDVVVRFAVAQEGAVRIRDTVVDVQVRLADRAGRVLQGELLGEVPAASQVLPSAALGSRGGGVIPVDARDERGLRTLQKVFAFDVAIPFVDALQYVGSRAYLRFEHPPVPLLARWHDSARRLVLSRVGE